MTTSFMKHCEKFPDVNEITKKNNKKGNYNLIETRYFIKFD